MTSSKPAKQSGFILITVLAVTEIFLVITLGMLGFVMMQYKLNLSKVASNQALHIAEAGVDYYRWVLYHSPQEYCNNETCCSDASRRSSCESDYGPYGPYVYKNFDGTIVGYYKLYIIPPKINGSTIVDIKSVGWEANHPTITRTIEVKCGIPSWSSFSVLSNDNNKFIRFGTGTEVFGPIFSNYGIRFDGLAHYTVTSGDISYDDPDDYVSTKEFGVHTHVKPPPATGLYADSPNVPAETPTSPTSKPPDRSDVFMGGRSTGATRIAFNLLDVDSLFSLATTSGLLFDPRASYDTGAVSAFTNCIGSACRYGYHITFNTNNTFAIKRVSAVYTDCSSAYNDPPFSSGATYSISSEDSGTTFNIPSNGVIFVEHNVWVDGTINGSRATIVAFTRDFSLTTHTTDININNNILYSSSTDVIGLIAQRNVNIGLRSTDNLIINAALIARDGRIGRNHYYSSCDSDYYKRNSITIVGSLATSKRYGFQWGDWVSGYHYRTLTYDTNLTFTPPPHFPTTGEYTFISWREN